MTPWLLLAASLAALGLWWWARGRPAAGWWAAWGLLVYVLFLTSTFWAERNQLWGAAERQWERDFAAARQEWEEFRQQSARDLREDWEAERQALLQWYVPGYDPNAPPPWAPSPRPRRR